MKSLSDYTNNIYSQFGEDGIIEKIFEIIGTTNKICVEFGAWDGFNLSNTANLWSNKEWKGILIESDFNRFGVMTGKTKDYNCLCLNIEVEPKGINSIENILNRENITINSIDLLSIDIDGFDYCIFRNLKWLKPRLIICEYNPAYPRDVIILPKEGLYKEGKYGGCSMLALTELAKSKGYTFIAKTKCNCFFVENKNSNLFEDYDV